MDVYSKLPKLYGMENFTPEEVMDKLDMFQGIFLKVGTFVWWDIEIIQTDGGTQFTPSSFRKLFLCVDYDLH